MHFYVIFPSGDPTRDMEYSDYNLSRRTDFIIPEPIRNFLTYFQKVVRDENIYEIQNAYENG